MKADPINRVHFGIVGCGRVAPRHAQAIEAHQNAKLVAVTDLIPERAAKLALDYGAAVESDYDSMLARDDIDVICLCTPSGLHAKMAMQGAMYHKSMIIEKPLALSLHDADELIDVCNMSGVKATVVLQNRYNPPIQRLKQACNQGRLGNLNLGAATVRWYRPQSYYEDGWHGTLEMDGGVLLNQGYHFIDILLWIFGEVHSVFAYAATLGHRIEVDDAVTGVMQFKSGAIASIEMSTITYPFNLEGSVAVFGTKGSVKIGGKALDHVAFWEMEGDEPQTQNEISSQSEDKISHIYGNGHYKVLDDMIDAIRSGQPTHTSLDDARNTLRIVLALYHSAQNRCEVII